MENGLQMTLEGFSPRTYRKQTAGVSDSPVRTSALPESSLALTEQEAAYFSELLDLCKTSKKRIDPHTYLLRTLKTYLALMGERTSLNFSLRWTKAGTMQNGRLSTLPITFRKTEKEFSLLDILEGEVPQKYFLSKEHPQETRLSQFLKYYPNAPLEMYGIPHTCVKNFGIVEYEYLCSDDCHNCWNTPIKEE